MARIRPSLNRAVSGAETWEADTPGGMAVASPVVWPTIPEAGGVCARSRESPPRGAAAERGRDTQARLPIIREKDLSDRNFMETLLGGVLSLLIKSSGIRAQTEKEGPGAGKRKPFPRLRRLSPAERL